MPSGYGPIVVLASSGSGSLSSLLWVLVCVIVIIVLAYLFTRYVAGRGALGLPGGSGQMKVLAHLALGREQSMALVQAGEKFLLLGVSAAGVELLAELTQEEAQAIYAPPDQPPPPSFRESLRTVLQQRKPR